MIYEQGQVRHVFPFVRHGTEWFIIGGPADANEAQIFCREFHGVKAVGFEPNKTSLQRQREMDFPGDLHPYALWSERTTMTISVPSGEWPHDSHQPHRMASVLRPFNDCSETYEVECRTLDDLSDEFGPFTNAFLWIDIEESELECVKGASRLLASGDIYAVNAEVLEFAEADIVNELAKHGFKEVHRWNTRTVSEGRRLSDVVFVKGE